MVLREPIRTQEIVYPVLAMARTGVVAVLPAIAVVAVVAVGAVVAVVVVVAVLSVVESLLIEEIYLW